MASLFSQIQQIFDKWLLHIFFQNSEGYKVIYYFFMNLIQFHYYNTIKGKVKVLLENVWIR